MNSILLAGMACLAASHAQGGACPAPPPPLPLLVAGADVVVVGKVTGFRDGLVSAAAPFGPGKADYRVAVVRVEEAVAGVKGVTEIRVGVVAPDQAPAGPAPAPLRFALRVGQEGLLFLMKHPSEDFYVGENDYGLIERRGGPAFDQAVEGVRRYAKLLADPGPALTGGDAGERLLAAALLVERWRVPRPGVLKAERVGAERSKQVLRALADADWNPAHASVYSGHPFTPLEVFLRLGLGPDDGWARPRDDEALAGAAVSWLRAHAGTYRIQRAVPEGAPGRRQGRNERTGEAAEARPADRRSR